MFLSLLLGLKTVTLTKNIMISRICENSSRKYSPKDFAKRLNKIYATMDKRRKAMQLKSVNYFSAWLHRIKAVYF